VNRAIQRFVAGVPDDRSVALGWLDPVGAVDRRLDRLFATTPEPDAALVAALAAALTVRQRGLVYHYGIRLLGRGVSAEDATVLRPASFAIALAYQDERDVRDLLIGLVPLHVAATRLHTEPAPVVGWLADRLPEASRAPVLQWASQANLEDRAYGWDAVETDDGVRFVVG
jgi:hypothetical protein